MPRGLRWWSGTTAAAVVIPQAMGYATVASVPAQFGHPTVAAAVSAHESEERHDPG